jgi:hypothetical protein
MLVSYQQRARLLLGDETFKWLRDGDLIPYINEARNQVAGESECLADWSTLNIDETSQTYSFSAIAVSAANVAFGYGPVLNVRQGAVQLGSGFQIIHPRAWAWFQIYTLDQVAPLAGLPEEFAQQGQGVSGTLWVNLSDTSYTLNLDAVCLPIPLVDDSTLEAIPQLWQIPVPYYAAWVAMMDAQAMGRLPAQLDPQLMLDRYKQQMERARTGATPQTLPHIWSQGPDLSIQNRYGIAGGR